MTKQDLAKELRLIYGGLSDIFSDEEVIKVNCPYTPSELELAIEVAEDAEQFLRMKEDIEQQLIWEVDKQ